MSDYAVCTACGERVLVVQSHRFVGDKQQAVVYLDARLERLEAENVKLRELLDEAQLRSIEARNPGIDMEEVKRIRAAKP